MEKEREEEEEEGEVVSGAGEPINGGVGFVRTSSPLSPLTMLPELGVGEAKVAAGGDTVLVLAEHSLLLLMTVLHVHVPELEGALVEAGDTVHVHVLAELSPVLSEFGVGEPTVVVAEDAVLHVAELSPTEEAAVAELLSLMACKAALTAGVTTPAQDGAVGE